MIEIVRPDKGPASFNKAGERQTRLDCAAYDDRPVDYNSGVVRFLKRKRIFTKEVKDLLIKIHRSKCCYCEKKYPASNLHIEHFRPRSGFRQTRNQKKDELPGYYWLSYRWGNLLLSCLDCNSKCKHTFFPLANPKMRARTHRDDVTKEHPLFIDPSVQNPRDHIRFDGDTPRGLTQKGRMTIEGIGLRRAELREDRLELLSRIDTHYSILMLPVKHPDIAELQARAREFIEAAKRPDHEFSSMVIDYVARRGL